MIAILDTENKLQSPNDYMISGEDSANIFKSDVEKQSIEKCFTTGKSVGIKAEIYSDSIGHYHPIKGQSKILGIIGIACLEKITLSENEEILLVFCFIANRFSY